MAFTIDNYIEKAKGIDFSKLAHGDFFTRKHPEIIKIIENIHEETNPENLATIHRILEKYFEILDKDIKANPEALKSGGGKGENKETSKQKNSKTKKQENKETQKQKKPRQSRKKLKKHKYKAGQFLYAYVDGYVEKSEIESLSHAESGEPTYVYRTDKGTKKEVSETVLQGLIRQKLARIDKPLPEHTEKVDAEVSFLRRFVAMNGKTKTHEELLTMLKSLQTAIIERRVRKASTYSGQIEYMQDKLIAMVNDGGSITVNFSEDKLTELKAITTGLATMPAVLVIKRFLRIQGKTGVKEEARKILEKIETGKAGVNASKPLNTKLKIIKRVLERYIAGSTITPTISQSELNGMEGLEGLDGLEKQNRKITVKSGKAMRSTDFEKKAFYPMGLSGKWHKLLGDMSEPFRLMIYGKGGSGKSTLAIDLAKYLADQMGKTVLFVANEEGFGATLQKKIKMLKAVHPDLFLVDKIPADLSKYDVVFLDSADSLRLSPEAATKLTLKYPNMNLVTIHKVTKTGNFRGSAEWEHDCDTSVVVIGGVARAEKNRFGGSGEISVF
ncbi:AAA family ATPase [Marinilabilia salmonicolor]|uniref:AAA family ATPase n=1 Tax=Marinilabilia salmonicolor TaxID=989 RepID=UPI00029A033B|nr:AAA family ATPase [Marinilabilia salmonicolor]